MATIPITEPNIYHTDNTSDFYKTTLSPLKANPLVADTPVEDDESAAMKEQQNKFHAPIGSVDFYHVSVEYSTIVVTPPAANNKAVLNIGGVRHEGNLDYFFPT